MIVTSRTAQDIGLAVASMLPAGGIRLFANSVPGIISAYGSDLFLAAGLYFVSGVGVNRLAQGNNSRLYYGAKAAAGFTLAAGAELAQELAGWGVMDPWDIAAHGIGIGMAYIVDRGIERSLENRAAEGYATVSSSEPGD